MIAGRNSTPETREQIRKQLGLDRPLTEQYLSYVPRLAQGDFGISYARKTDVGDLIASRLPATLLLMLGAIVAELLIGIPAGIYAAARRGDAGRQGGDDAVLRSPSRRRNSCWASRLLYVFAYLLGWFPLERLWHARPSHPARASRSASPAAAGIRA